MAKITSKDSFFYNIFNEYKRTSDFNSSRIRQDLTKELETSRDYKGREIYELIQNAEDAHSKEVVIKLDKKTIFLLYETVGLSANLFPVRAFNQL